MGLFVLGFFLIVSAAITVAVTVVALMVLRRCWPWLRPAAAIVLLLLGTAAIFDVMASANAAPSVERGNKKTQSERDLFGEPAGSIQLGPHDAAATDPQAPQWTRRKTGELLSTAKETVEVTVHAGPCLSRTDCEIKLGKAVSTVVDDYIRTEIAPQTPADVAVPMQYIHNTLVRDSHVSLSKHEFKSVIGAEEPEMVEMYALVRFDPASKQHLRDLCRESLVHTRMKTAAAALAGVLGALTLGWAVLRREPKPPATV